MLADTCFQFFEPFILILLITRNILYTLFLSFIIRIYLKKCKESEKSEEKVGDLGWKRHFHFYKLS
jgi:hypothetical protein